MAGTNALFDSYGRVTICEAMEAGFSRNSFSFGNCEFVSSMNSRFSDTSDLLHFRTSMLEGKKYISNFFFPIVDYSMLN